MDSRFKLLDRSKRWRVWGVIGNLRPRGLLMNLNQCCYSGPVGQPSDLAHWRWAHNVRTPSPVADSSTPCPVTESTVPSSEAEDVVVPSRRFTRQVRLPERYKDFVMSWLIHIRTLRTLFTFEDLVLWPWRTLAPWNVSDFRKILLFYFICFFFLGFLVLLSRVRRCSFSY